MRTDIIILSINLLLYLFAFMKYKAHSLLSIGSVTFLLYSVLALMSLLMVCFTTTKPINLNAFALVYLYICILISFKPLSLVNKSGLSVSPPSIQPFKVLLSIIVLFAIARFPSVISNFSGIVTGFLLDSSVFYDQYNTAMETYTQVQSDSSYNFLTIILGLFDRYIPFFLMYYLTFQNRNRFLVLGLILGLVIAPMHGLISAQRGIMVDTIIACILAYSLFKDCYSERVNRIVRITGAVFVAGVVLSLAMITFSRFNQSFMEEGNVQRSIYAYSGQAMTNFGEFGLDAGGIRYGDRTIPLLKKTLFIDGAYDYAHRMVKYPNLKLDEGLFSTYVGDLVIDFGPLLAFVLILIMTVLFKNMISHKGYVIPMYKMIPAYILGYIILCGWHLYPFADFGGNLSLIIGFLLYFYFKRFRTFNCIK